MDALTTLDDGARLTAASGDPIAFAEAALRVIDDGSFTSTYKLAVLMALLDIAREWLPRGRDVPIPTRMVADRVVELYWPQADLTDDGLLLRQAAGGANASVISAIQVFTAAQGGSRSCQPAMARVREPDAYAALVRRVENTLFKDVLRRLQYVEDAGEVLFLYEMPAGASRRTSGRRSDFPHGLVMLPGAVENLVRFEPLLRPLIQRRWAGLVAGFRGNYVRDYHFDLERFLFGAERTDLSPISAVLSQRTGRVCFYCRRTISGVAHVDHFVPWARHRDNGIDNLVLTDSRCNLGKGSRLAALPHLRRWLLRFTAGSEENSAIAAAAVAVGWERDSTRTLAGARTTYLLGAPLRPVWDPGGVTTLDLAAARSAFGRV